MLYSRHHNYIREGALKETLVRTKADVKGMISDEQSISLGVQMNNRFLNYKDFDNYTAILLNPYYEHLYKRLNNDISALIRLREMLLSNGFWEFVYGKLSEESIFTDRIDRKLHSIVKALFNCGVSAETKKTLADVYKKLRELSVA